MLLPETKGEGLPETVEDLELMWKKSKKRKKNVVEIEVKADEELNVSSSF